MASSVTVVVFSVLCLILIQNLVYSKPAPQAPPAGVDPAKTPAAPGSPVPGDQPNTGAAGTAVKPPGDDKKPNEETTMQTTGQTTKTPETPKPAVTVTPSAQAGEKKDSTKGGSAIVYANFGLLAITASVLMRL